MRLSFENEAEQLDYELGYLIDHSKDRNFKGFLYQLRGELCCNPEKAGSIRSKAISTYDVYVANMNALGKPVEQYYYGAIYKGMEAPSIGDVKAPDSPKPVFDSQPVINTVTEPDVNLQMEYIPEPEATPQQAFVPEPEVTPQQAFVPEPEVTPQQVFVPEPEPVPQFASAPQPEFVSHNGPVFHGKAEAPKAEYAVGAIVMSVLGAVFLLTGLVYFAVNFLDTFAQGMLMYLICIGVLAVSELVIRKLVVKLSSVFTAIGISGLFLATVVNYRALENISLPVCAFILGICAVVVCLFGYFRKSRLYSAIGFFAAFASSAAIGSDSTPAQYMVITIGTLLISCMWMIFPAPKQYKLADTFMIIAEIVYCMLGVGFRIDCDNDLTVKICKFVFLILSWFVVQFIYYHTVRKESEYENSVSTTSMANKVIMCLASCLYIFYAVGGLFLSGLDESVILVSGILVYAAFVIPSAVFGYLLFKAGKSSWIIYYLMLGITGIIGAFGPQNTYFFAVVIAVHGLFGRWLSSRLPEDNTLKVTDLLIQLFMAFVLVFTSEFFAPRDGEFGLQMYFTCAVLVISFMAGLFISSGYSFVVQIISVFAVTVGIITVFIPDVLKATCGMGMILGFTCLINHVPKLKPDNEKLFNWFAVVMEIIFLHMTAIDNNQFVLQDGLIYMITLLFGLCFLILMLNRDYGMPFSEKYILIPIYLTWAFIISPLNKDFLLSIILMAVAVAGVVFGFMLKEKAIRVYGLVLSIVVCAKIAFIDFVTLDDVKSKTIMYIMVGAFALLIGTIYMVLESRESKASGQITDGGAS